MERKGKTERERQTKRERETEGVGERAQEASAVKQLVIFARVYLLVVCVCVCVSEGGSVCGCALPTFGHHLKNLKTRVAMTSTKAHSKQLRHEALQMEMNSRTGRDGDVDGANEGEMRKMFETVVPEKTLGNRESQKGAGATRYRCHIGANC